MNYKITLRTTALCAIAFSASIVSMQKNLSAPQNIFETEPEYYISVSGKTVTEVNLMQGQQVMERRLTQGKKTATFSPFGNVYTIEDATDPENITYSYDDQDHKAAQNLYQQFTPAISRRTQYGLRLLGAAIACPLAYAFGPRILNGLTQLSPSAVVWAALGIGTYTVFANDVRQKLTRKPTMYRSALAMLGGLGVGAFGGMSLAVASSQLLDQPIVWSAQRGQSAWSRS